MRTLLIAVSALVGALPAAGVPIRQMNEYSCEIEGEPCPRRFLRLEHLMDENRRRNAYGLSVWPEVTVNYSAIQVRTDGSTTYRNMRFAYDYQVTARLHSNGADRTGMARIRASIGQRSLGGKSPQIAFEVGDWLCAAPQCYSLDGWFPIPLGQEFILRGRAAGYGYTTAGSSQIVYGFSATSIHLELFEYDRKTPVRVEFVPEPSAAALVLPALAALYAQRRRRAHRDMRKPFRSDSNP